MIKKGLIYIAVVFGKKTTCRANKYDRIMINMNHQFDMSHPYKLMFISMEFSQQ